MSNLFFNAQQAANNKSFRFNKLNGLNNKGNGHSKIQVVGQIDSFTLKTLYENYDVIAQNLKVYPTIKVHPRGSKIEGGFDGYYHSSNNHIDIIDHYHLISLMAHEMRHAYQYIYFPDLFYNSAYNTAQGYLNCEVERDAREYAMDYCTARNYREELEHLKEDEKQIELIINNEISPAERGLSNEYFRANPSVAYNVPRSYHLDQEYEVESSSSNVTRIKRKIRWWRLFGNLLTVAAIIYGLILLNDEDSNEEKAVSVTETQNTNGEEETAASAAEPESNSESDASTAEATESEASKEIEESVTSAAVLETTENTANTAQSVPLEEQLIASAMQYFDDIGGDSSQLSLYEPSWETEYYDGTYYVMPFSDGNRITTILGDESGTVYLEGEIMDNGKISAIPIE